MKARIPIFNFMLFLIFTFSANGAETNQKNSLKINIFSLSNGKGLENSRRILKDHLLEMGHEVFEKGFVDRPRSKQAHADINIFFEKIVSRWIPYASTNWFIPNPEWYRQSITLLNRIDLILCRTYQVERIFKSLGKKTYYLGFTSLDCKDPSIEKDYFSYLHVAGGSPFKGTKAILKAWETALGMPNLTAVVHINIPFTLQQNVDYIKERLPLDELRFLQNQCGVHLCISEAEGFGHYLMEAMSTGAVVITTDAPPMNEFIADRRCLVPYDSCTPCKLGIRYFADVSSLQEVVQNLMFLSHDELKAIGDKNRSMFLKKTEEFRHNLRRLLENYQGKGS